MTELAAESLDPTQAAELTRVLDLQAAWENTRVGPGGAEYSTADLRHRQRVYEAFRSGLTEYTARYRTTQLPEVTLNNPQRVGAWCRVLRAVFRRAESVPASPCPAAAVERTYRIADRIATRLGKAPVGRAVPSTDLAGAIQELSAVIQWCDDLAAATPDPRSPRPPEVGAAAAPGARAA